jgi:hypothetical protein
VSAQNDQLAAAAGAVRDDLESPLDFEADDFETDDFESEEVSLEDSVEVLAFFFSPLDELDPARLSVR